MAAGPLGAQNKATGLEAKPIHRLLKVAPKSFGFKRARENPLECDLLVVDESSMVDVLMMQSLLDAAPCGAAMLIVGDIDRYRPSASDRLWPALLSHAPLGGPADGAVPPGAQSRIITSAHQINCGRIPDLAKPAGETELLPRAGR